MHTIRIKNKLSDQEEIEELVVEVRMCIFSGQDLRSGTTSSETKSRAALSGQPGEWSSAAGSPASTEERLCRTQIQRARQSGLAPSPSSVALQLGEPVQVTKPFHIFSHL